MDWLKFCTMTPLEEQAVERNICPKCHRKTLAHKHDDGEQDWMQCRDCLTVYVLPARRLVG